MGVLHDPGSVVAFELVALTLQHQGLLKEAEAATLETTDPERVLCELAGLHAERGDTGEARRLFELALEESVRSLSDLQDDSR